jgi:hypothetical protein
VNPLLDTLSGGIVRDLAAVHQLLELHVGIISIAVLAKMFLVIQIEVQDDRRRIGEAEEQTIPLQPLFVTSVFPEGAS